MIKRFFVIYWYILIGFVSINVYIILFVLIWLKFVLFFRLLKFFESKE